MSTPISDLRKVAIRLGIVLAAAGVIFTGSVTATSAPGVILQTSVTELEIIQLFGRLHELLRNIAYLLGPIVLLHGITLWAIASNNERWSQRGYSAAVGGFILFGLSLAMDILLQAAAFIGDV